MTRVLDRDAVLDAFGLIGAEASLQGVVLHIVVYGGSALILASNFRFSSEDVDIAEIPEPRPAWLADLVTSIAVRNGWSPDWLNDAVTVHLSYGLADRRLRSETLRAEPALVEDVRLNALVGAMADYLARRHGADIPRWASGPARTLREPWFTTERPGPGISEYLWHSSPAEFRSRNIFTDATPLRRASQRQPAE